MKKSKVDKVLPVVTKAKAAESRLKEKFENTDSEAKRSGDVTQAFARVLDIVEIPGFGVEILLKPTPEDPSTSRSISYLDALNLVRHMTRMLAKMPFYDISGVAEMFTKFKMKLLEAINNDEQHQQG